MRKETRGKTELEIKADQIVHIEESIGAAAMAVREEYPRDILSGIAKPEPKVDYRPTKLCQMPEEKKNEAKKHMLENGVIPVPSFFLTSSMGRAVTKWGHDLYEDYLHCLSEMLLSKDSGRMQNKILADMIKDAFRDRFVVYTESCDSANPSEIAMYSKLRIEQDRHLVFLLKTFQEMNRPPLKVSIKSAESVNIGDTVDKQLNISIADREGSN